MRIKLFTFRYSATLAGFDDEPLREFLRDKDALAFREHFFCVNEVPHIACVLLWQEPVVTREDAGGSRCAAEAPRPAGRTPAARGDDRQDPAAGLDERERTLFNALREWRARKAHDEGVPPYLVFTNRQFTRIVRKRPDTASALASIEGVGSGKVNRYGAEILAFFAPAAETASAAGGPA